MQPFQSELSDKEDLVHNAWLSPRMAAKAICISGIIM